MTAAEAFDIIMNTDDMFISPELAARVTHLSEKKVREQAIADAENGTRLLGYSCTVTGRSVRVNKQSFIAFVLDQKE